MDEEEVVFVVDDDDYDNVCTHLELFHHGLHGVELLHELSFSGGRGRGGFLGVQLDDTVGTGHTKDNNTQTSQATTMRKLNPDKQGNTRKYCVVSTYEAFLAKPRVEKV